MSIFTGVLYFILWLGLVTIFVVYVTCSNAVFMFWFPLWWIIKLYSIKEQRNVGYSLLIRLVTFSLTIKLSIATFKNSLPLHLLSLSVRNSAVNSPNTNDRSSLPPSGWTQRGSTWCLLCCRYETNAQ